MLALAACGGGGDDLGSISDALSASAPGNPSASTPSPTLSQSIGKAPITLPTPINSALQLASVAGAATSPSGTDPAAAKNNDGSTATTAGGDAAAATTLVAGAAGFTALTQAFGTTDAASRFLTPSATSTCEIGWRDLASLDSKQPAPMPAGGGVFYGTDDLALWRQRINGSAFVSANDVVQGSPADWTTIKSNAQSFTSGREPAWDDANTTLLRTTHGTLLRDAAFVYLVRGDASLLPGIRARLLTEARNPANELQRRCLRDLGGPMIDAWFGEASWLLRYSVAYDFARGGLSADDRTVIDNFLRRNAYVLAAQLDLGLGWLFPNRHSGNYNVRSRDAAATGDAAYTKERADTNGDCRVDSADPAIGSTNYNYVRADGSTGPRTSLLSQWYNNRKAVNAAFVGAAGVLLGDADLIVRAKRYVMEWLAYSVWPDGSQGEYLRNGDYCIANQGVIYAAANEQSALLIARLLTRQGDRSLFSHRTRLGLFGSESVEGDGDKSIELVISTHVRLLTGDLKWYMHEGWKSSQAPRAQTALGATQVSYNAGSPMDDYHELGMLLAARDLTSLPINGLVLRQSSVTKTRFPGSTGLPVATGFGSWAGSWTDAFNALPAMLFLYASPP